MEFILIILSSLLFTIPYYFPALFFLSWFAFIPLVYLIRDYDYNHSFIIALLVGFLNSVFSFYWLYHPLSTALKMPFSFNLFILFIYFLLSALPLAVWVLVNKFLQPEHSYSPFIAALSWTVLEYLRFEFFNFNPFNYFAYTQSSFALIVQYASYGGIFIVSFISVLIASYFVKIYLEPAWKKFLPLLLIFLILIAVPFFIQPATDAEINSQSVDLLVSNSEQGNNIFEKIETEIDKLSVLVENSESKFIFTPEKSLSFDLIRNNYYRDQFFSQLGNITEPFYLQLGAQAAAEESYNAEVLNSLFLISGEMEVINRNNQDRNIIAGLNFPYLREITDFLTDYLNFSVKQTESPDTAVVVEAEELHYINLFAEEIFIPLVSREKSYTQGQNLIVHSAAEAKINSAVYNNFSFAAAVYRAAETNTDLIRAIRGGFSGYINERGKVVKKLRIKNSRETFDLVLQKKESYYQKYPARIINIIIILFSAISLIKIIIIVKNKWSSRN
ncbi:apolipoprotein N-acyltransferase [Halanaerobium saccharolyticum]|uniref:Apolipoprotein N-acyltransferase n=1 Tax=Halanaerobium saccharolyticum TaxID=43595 RepID=A0A4R7YWM8_9FIRM|nr:copper homeostasis protein CutE [Halanaerobium saccharolyticum]RAK07379.1 apolipoprotein N-acyltransferase [Halanaerobium saccharolyticum]TDW02344.1 apolipoprotein N-acyltransferase [Halanaerobium saccharolyticum]TDX59064.1 apolipoprotein N-acyltransferase [Halanaerobium saccharolyticum]